MDPLHPIVPIAPNIPPIMPAPLVGGVSRDSSRAGGGQDPGRRRRAQREPGQDGLLDDELDYAADHSDGEDDSGLHIDVTA
ncbi:MAG TPA: hypothetical protein VMF57_05275 [Solirubrobacteraceae bacterium]|nr:hypothetical protein [Solirubrobacteraceae bacterium]